jgi:four helix bundle protein
MSKEKAQPARPFDLDERLIVFAGRVVEVVSALPKTPVGKHLGGQLLRSETSPMANYVEAQGAESRNDFVHKMKVSLKELREARVWLLLIRRKKMAGSARSLDPLLGECDELISILFASIRTAQKNQAKQTPFPADT